jgi:hypothetical protein
MAASELQRSIRGTSRKVDETLGQLAEIKGALKSSGRGDVQLFEEARRLELKLQDASTLLVGRTIKSRHSEPDRLSIMSRVSSALSTSGSTHGPTLTHRRDYRIAREEFETVLGEVKELIEVDFVKLQRDLEVAGLPWTSGRPIPGLKQ